VVSAGSQPTQHSDDFRRFGSAEHSAAPAAPALAMPELPALLEPLAPAAPALELPPALVPALELPPAALAPLPALFAPALE
jgi:hypothetical protein